MGHGANVVSEEACEGARRGCISVCLLVRRAMVFNFVAMEMGHET